MKNTHLFLIAMLLAAICSSQTGFGADDIHVRQPTTYAGPAYVPGQIIVKFSPGVSEAAIAQVNEKNQAKVAYTSRFAGFRVLAFPETIPPQAMVNIYAKNPNVEYAELNYIASAFGVPNDLYYGYQWHLDNGTYGGIGMEEAWPLSKGAGVTVAVVDTGVRDGGPDGIATVIRGRDFVNSDDDPTDDEGHGTHVAGTIAQRTNNATGVAGVAPDCSILAVKVLGADGSGTYAWIADGIHYAADHGAKVINMSLGGSSGAAVLEEAVEYAYNKGVTIVCASGNNGWPIVSYPAAYDAYCIAVGATRYDEAVTGYSNGGTALDLTAPGGDVTVDQNGDGYGDGVLQETFDGGGWGYWFYQGTSMASPHVAGVAALLISQGTYTTPDQVRNRLQSTAKDKGPTGWDSSYGWGIVNAAAALGSSTPPPAPTLSSIAVTPASATVDIGGTQQYTAVGTYSNGDPEDITSSVTWRSSKTRVATIDSSGLATGAKRGTTTITATLDGITSNQATLTVSAAAAPTLSSIDVTPASASITVNGTQQFTATGRYSDGSTQDITSSAAWSSSNALVASISSSGLATGTGIGTAYITATLAGIPSNEARLDVTSSSTPERILHVARIVGWPEQPPRFAGRNMFARVFADVEIVDGDRVRVEGATVTGEWSIAANGTSTGVTDVVGITRLTSPEAKVPKSGTLVFLLTIIDVQKDGYTYDGVPADCEIPWP